MVVLTEPIPRTGFNRYVDLSAFEPPLHTVDVKEDGVACLGKWR